MNELLRYKSKQLCRQTPDAASGTEDAQSGSVTSAATGVQRTRIQIPVDGFRLEADLALPAGATALVLFAHDSGSSRLSPRNRRVADVLNRGLIGTVLADLLTEDEEAEDLQTGELRFNIRLLAGRLTAITDWIADQGTLNALGVGYFGASTGAAAALAAAAERPRAVRAVVSRGGRPDLTGPGIRAGSRTLSFYRRGCRSGGSETEPRRDRRTPAGDGAAARNHFRRNSLV